MKGLVRSLTKSKLGMLAAVLSITVCASSAYAGSSPALFTDRYDEQIRDAVRKFWWDYSDWKDWKAQLYQESQLDPSAESNVGAAGLAQFMPGTWAEVSRQLGFGNVSPHETTPAILAGAYYMARLRQVWQHNRSGIEKQQLAQASYNTGTGNVLKAQTACNGVRLWGAIAPCLRSVTGRSAANQTITYVERIAYWRALMR